MIDPSALHRDHSFYESQRQYDCFRHPHSCIRLCCPRCTAYLQDPVRRAEKPEQTAANTAAAPPSNGLGRGDAREQLTEIIECVTDLLNECGSRSWSVMI